MANINLLPWREEAREKHKRDYLGILALVFLVSSLLVYVALMVVDSMTEEQRGRNAYLTSEIQLLEKQIAEIKKIRERKKILSVAQKLFLIYNKPETYLPTF